jgi:predicted kinase
MGRTPSAIEASRLGRIRYHQIVAECVIFVGLPASGKTTFYQQRFSATHRHISKDHWPSASNKEARQAALISAALSENAPIVIDNTNPSISERASVVALARAHGARIIGYYFTATTREAVGRNRGREGKERVPDVAIFTKAKHMSAPTAAEGFDELYAVTIRDDGSFDVRVRGDEGGGQ